MFDLLTSSSGPSPIHVRPTDLVVVVWQKGVVEKVSQKGVVEAQGQARQ
jgi:hypothetical protein